MNEAIIVQQPAPHAWALVLLFHGVGATADDLVALAQPFAAALPHALVVSVNAPHACDMGRGHQWFSVQGVTENNRLDRVAQAMPLFEQTVAGWQREAGVDAAHTTLVGFSQGAIMALESTQLASVPARCVVAIAGRYAQPPHRAPIATTVHLLHGRQDGVIPVAQSVDAASRLQQLGATVTVDLYAGLGHGIDARVIARVVELLSDSAAAPAGAVP